MALNNTPLESGELSQMLNNYQSTGNAEVPEAPKQIIAPVQREAAPVEEAPKKRPRWRPSGVIAQDYTPEALAAGFGTSKYDSDYYPGKDLEDSRAISQSAFSKIGTGLTKGGVTAATTAVNTTLGTVFGIGSALYELAADADGDGRSLMDTIDAGTNNWLSQQLTKIQDWSEQQFPNYRTEEERSEQYQKEWYRHMGTANFIGDSLLKNFGFTVGAMVGGMAWTKLIGKAMSAKLANDIMKGAAVAAEGDAAATEELMRAAEAIRRGTAIGVDGQKLSANLQKVAREINKMEARLQLYGAAIGAMGEGTVEGLMAKKEFLDDFNARTQRLYAQEYGSLEQEILNSGDSRYVKLVADVDMEGKFAGSYHPELKDEGRAYLAQRQREVTEKYQNLQRQAEEEGQRLASTTFLLNLPILTTSNAVQFGRMLSGGWKTARKSLPGLRGIISTANGAIKGEFSSSSNVAVQTVLGSLKVAGTESFEEMAQGTISSGAKQVAANNLTSFNDDGYDAVATDEVRDWFAGMYKGGKEYLSDIKNWQEGALGAITGLFGIPGRRWSGGIAEAYRTAKEEVNLSREAADVLNREVNSQAFQDRWRSYIRHLKYDREMNEALAKDDEYSWHNAEDKQLINDVIMFSDYGRLEDLNQIVSAWGNLSEADAENIKGLAADTTKQDNPYSWAKDLSAGEIIAKVKEQADHIKNTIQEYKDVYDAISARAPQDASKEQIKEMVFTAMQVNAFDKRFMQMFGDVMIALDNPLMEEAKYSEDGEELSHDAIIAKYRDYRNRFERFFAGQSMPRQLTKGQFLDTMETLADLSSLVGDDPQLAKKVEDMQKLSLSRQDFYKKLQTLETLKPKDYNKQAITPDKVEDKAEETISKMETAGLDTPAAFREEYLKKSGKEASDFIRSVEAIEKDNPAAAQFLKLKRRYDDFMGYLDNHPINPSNASVTPNMLPALLGDLLYRVNSEDEFFALDDSAFMSLDEFRQNVQSLSPIRDGAYTSLKQDIRKAMKEYAKTVKTTEARENISSSPVSAEPTEVHTSSGPDAANPASVSPTPQKEEGEKKKSEKKEEPTPVEPKDTPMPEDAGGATRLSREAMNASDSNPVTVSTVEVSGKKQKTSYHCSVPEVDNITEAPKARKARLDNSPDAYRRADLSDFVHQVLDDDGNPKMDEQGHFVYTHPEFASVWLRLKELRAFDAVATQLNVGDEVEFVIDPNLGFEDYNGQQPIVVRRATDHQVLTILLKDTKTTSYIGLAALRQKIYDEYEAWKVKPENTGKAYTFGKTSKIWALQPGLVEFDYSSKGEKPLNEFPELDTKAPIVFIDKSGQARVLRGDATAADKVSPEFNSPSRNQEKIGFLYYLVKSPNGKYSYVPIAIRTIKFTRDSNSVKTNNDIFDEVRTKLNAISKLASEVTLNNVQGKRNSLRSKVDALAGLLDIHNVDIKFTNKDKKLYLTVTDNSRAEEIFSQPVESVNPADFIDAIASLNRPFQVRLDKNGRMPNLQRYIDSGILTTNATKLRPKGVDFYFNPWNEKTEEFAPMSDEQLKAEAEIEEVKKKEEKPVSQTLATPVTPSVPASIKKRGFSGRDDDFDEGEEVSAPTAEQKEAKVKEIFSSVPELNAVGAKFRGKNVREIFESTLRNIVLHDASVVPVIQQAIEKAVGPEFSLQSTIDNFSFLLDSVVSEEEKSKLKEEYQELDELELYDMYTTWLSGLAKTTSKKATATLKDAFTRIKAILDNADSAKAIIPGLKSAVGNESPRTISKLASPVVLKKFDNLSKDFQEGLLADGINDYDKQTELEQDKSLHCLGV